MANPQNFDLFYKDLKETEQKDSVLTPRQQIERLLRPGKTDKFFVGMQCNGLLILHNFFLILSH